MALFNAALCKDTPNVGGIFTECVIVTAYE
jgi:hypothetical protein